LPFVAGPGVNREPVFQPIGGQPPCLRIATATVITAPRLPYVFERVLLNPIRPDIKDGMDVVWREREGLRIVILTDPTPNMGAVLVKTVYRVKPQANAVKSTR
ncbi:hypothetical protein, partial [Sphingopyxis bauzanensis]|uniref:hypothetical protein n=1 Tax=Sphingopyxis bauzanensis TaxID=651663 RepID=UPI001E581326